MKTYEKESFFKIFIVFLSTLTVLCGIIFYLYYRENKDHIQEDLFYQMKDYSFNFKGKKFSLDIVKKDKNVKFSKLYILKSGLVVYFPMPKNGKFILKVMYNQKKFQADLDFLRYKILKLSLLTLLIGFVFSFYFASYSLKPMKNAIFLLEMFLKDLIHDLHTPITSILLNTKLLSRKEPSEEVERIELSAKTISSLYKNLEILKNEIAGKMAVINLKNVIEQRIKILQKLYPNIKIVKQLNDLTINTNENAISRILDNILTNACKYNKKNGKVFVIIDKNTITVKDTGIGIKNTKKVFDRYYKENERGLGLGLNIVKRLCDELKIGINIKSEINKGTIVELTLN